MANACQPVYMLSLLIVSVKLGPLKCINSVNSVRIWVLRLPSSPICFTYFDFDHSWFIWILFCAIVTYYIHFTSLIFSFCSIQYRSVYYCFSMGCNTIATTRKFSRCVDLSVVIYLYNEIEIVNYFIIGSELIG